MKRLDVRGGNEELFAKKVTNYKKAFAKLDLTFNAHLDLDSVRIDENGSQYIQGVVEYTLPDLNAYRIIATLERVDNKNLITIIDDNFIPVIDTNIRTKAPVCDHCNTKRNRRYMYLIWDDKNKKVLQLGKSCSKYFVGEGNVEQLYTLVQDLNTVSGRTFNEKIAPSFEYVNTHDILEVMKKIEYINVFKMGDPKYGKHSRLFGESRWNNKELSDVTLHFFKRTLHPFFDDFSNDDVYQELFSVFDRYLDKRKDDVSNRVYNFKTLTSKQYIRTDKLEALANVIRPYVSVAHTRYLSNRQDVEEVLGTFADKNEYFEPMNKPLQYKSDKTVKLLYANRYNRTAKHGDIVYAYMLNVLSASGYKFAFSIDADDLRVLIPEVVTRDYIQRIGAAELSRANILDTHFEIEGTPFKYNDFRGQLSTNLKYANIIRLD